jgi:hypothetical protein
MMGWVRQLLNNTDLALGLVLNVVLGSVIGFAMSHPLGHLLLGSALGVIFLLTYMASYSLGAIWMMGTQPDRSLRTCFPEESEKFCTQTLSPL